jgi:hypothetical protein
MAEPVSGRATTQSPGRPDVPEEPDGSDGSAPAVDSAGSHDGTPGHPEARGTLPMARLLTDPAVEEWIQQLAASAPPMTEDQRARLSRLLRLNRVRTNRQAA